MDDAVAAELPPEIIEANEFFVLGQKYFRKGNIWMAFDLFCSAMHVAPNVPVYRVAVADTASRIARPSEFLRDVAYFNASEACRMEARPDFYTVLGEIAISNYKFPEAIAALERACHMNSKSAHLWGLLGWAQSGNRDWEKARDCFDKAVELDPEMGLAHVQLSMFYMGIDHWNMEKAAYHGECGMRAKTVTALAREGCWNAALAYLHTGEYGKGWSYFEVRLMRTSFNQGQILPWQRFTKKMWAGERNCRVLITAEMGYGDSFIMVRFLPIIAEKYDFQLLLECRKQNLEVMQASFPDVKCVLAQEINEDDFDHHIPMMSLPHVLRLKSNKIPNEPYMKADPKKVEEWKNRLAANLHADYPNIGICWAGSSRSYNSQNHETDKRRSLNYNQIRDVFLKMPGINWVSLQHEAEEFPMIEGVKDFGDTAAIIENLDAVVSVDTAVINLAGAMGKPGWALNRYDHCWRWSDSLKTPWYPSIKKIRQPSPGEWQPVLDQLMDELKIFCGKIAAS